MHTRSRLLRLLAVAGTAAALWVVLAVSLAPAAQPSSAVAGGAELLAGVGLGGHDAKAGVRPSTGPMPPLDAGKTRLRDGEALTPRAIDSLTGYTWPLPRGRLTQPFGPSAGNSFLVGGVETHDGIDVATFCGDRIVAAHDGVVLTAGRAYQQAVGWRGDLAPYLAWLDAHHGWGDLPITVVIDDGDTYRSVYAHFSRIVVAVGQRVRAGDLLGYEGRTGHATGCHLHFGLFSPLETATWALRPDIVASYRLPPAETAHVDPLLVLPSRVTTPAPKQSRWLLPADRSEAL